MSTEDRFAAAFDQVLELAVLLNEDINQGLAREGLTPSRAHLLWELHHRGPSTQRVLAEALNVSARNITGLVDALVETGFVTRQPHPTDRRAALVSFTKRGARVAAKMAADHKEAGNLLFADMPAPQFDCFAKGLEHLLGRLRTAVQQAGPSSTGTRPNSPTAPPKSREGAHV